MTSHNHVAFRQILENSNKNNKNNNNNNKAVSKTAHETCSQKCQGWIIKNRTRISLYKFVLCWPILIQSNAFFSWEYENFRMVKHVFLRWVVSEIRFGLSQNQFWEFQEFVNFSENGCKIHRISKTQNFFLNHNSGTTQRRKTCFTILKFAYPQLKNAILWIKIGQHVTNL